MEADKSECAVCDHVTAEAEEAAQGGDGGGTTDQEPVTEGA